MGPSIRRAELHSPASSPRSSPDPELLDAFQRQVKDDLTFVEYDSGIKSASNAEHEQGEDTMMFRLFASAPSTKQAQSVRIRSPSVEVREPGLVQPYRPSSYYFTEPVSAAARRHLNSAAVEGKDVIARSKNACPGCYMPWRVSIISAAQDRSSGAILTRGTSPTQSGSSGKKTKPGKKHRIALRIKRAAAQAAQQAQQQTAADKEAAEREKRTRRNREKKVKRKEKEKAKKTAAVAPAAEPG